MFILLKISFFYKFIEDWIIIFHEINLNKLEFIKFKTKMIIYVWYININV